MVDIPQFLTLVLTSISIYLQFQQLTFSTGLTLGALLGGLIGAIFAGLISILRDISDNNIKRHDDKIKVISRLEGESEVLAQLRSDMWEYAIYIESKRKEKNHLVISDDCHGPEVKDEVKEMVKKIEQDLSEDIDKHYQIIMNYQKYREKWSRDLALVKIYFDNPQFNTNLKKYEAKIEDSGKAIRKFAKNLEEEPTEAPIKIEFDLSRRTHRTEPIWRAKKLIEFELLADDLLENTNDMLDEIKKYL